MKLKKLLSISETCNGLPEIQNLVTDSPFPINHGAVVAVSCEKGYRHQGDQVLECNEDQDFRFNTEPSCLQSELFTC